MFDIAKNFTYHAPTPLKQKQYKQLRDEAAVLARMIEGSCPDSREKSLAFTKLEEAVMWANASIARSD